VQPAAQLTLPSANSYKVTLHTIYQIAKACWLLAANQHTHTLAFADHTIAAGAAAAAAAAAASNAADQSMNLLLILHLKPQGGVGIDQSPAATAVLHPSSL
jgi:hypothetical protein